MKIRLHSILLILSLLITACGGGTTPPPSYTVSTSAGMGGSFNPTSRTVNEGDTTSFTVLPDEGYTINSVDGCGGILVGNIFTTDTITSDCTVTASFNIITLTVATNAGIGGNIDPTSNIIDWSTSTTFTVTPEGGYDIDTVSGCGGALDGNTFTTGSITSDCTVTASFNIMTLTVGTNAGAGGSIGPTSNIIDWGTSTTFTVTPEAGYDIDTVSGCGGTLDGNTFTTGSITSDCTVTASFNIITLTVGTNAGAGGSIGPTSNIIDWGTSTTFTVTPEAGYDIDTVSGCGGTLDGNTFTTGTITSDCTVTASFNIITLTVGTNAGAGGSIDPISRTVNWGTSTTFTITPDVGFEINTADGCGGTLVDNTFTTGLITADCTVTIDFRLLTTLYTLNVDNNYQISRTGNLGDTVSVYIEKDGSPDPVLVKNMSDSMRYTYFNNTNGSQFKVWLVSENGDPVSNTVEYVGGEKVSTQKLTIDSSYQISRDGNLSDDVSWVIEKDGYKVLTKSAINELSYTYTQNINNSFYRVWLEQSINGTVEIVSNVIYYINGVAVLPYNIILTNSYDVIRDSIIGSSVSWVFEENGSIILEQDASTKLSYNYVDLIANNNYRVWLIQSGDINKIAVSNILEFIPNQNFAKYTIGVNLSYLVSRDGSIGDEGQWVVEKDDVIVLVRVASSELTYTYYSNTSGSNFRIWIQSFDGSGYFRVSNIAEYSVQ